MTAFSVCGPQRLTLGNLSSRNGLAKITRSVIFVSPTVYFSGKPISVTKKIRQLAREKSGTLWKICKRNSLS